jgi:hypothetical protein
MARLKDFHDRYVTPDRIRPVFVTGYARRFNEEELKALIAHFESPVVRRFQDEQQAVIAEAGAVISAIYREFAAEFQRALMPPTT